MATILQPFPDFKAWLDFCRSLDTLMYTLVDFIDSQPTLPLGYNLDATVQQLIQSLMNLGGLVAAFFVGIIGNFFGRKMGLWLASAFGVVAISIQIGSNSTGALYVGRLLLGFSNGLFIPFCVMYMAEVSPAHLRGPIIGLVQWQISFGALIGILVDNYTNTMEGKKSYQIPLAVMYVVPVFITLFLLFLPETPRFLISKGHYEKAASAIRRTRGITDAFRLEAEVTDIKNTWLEEQEMQKGTSVIDMFKGTDLRRTLISIGVTVCQSASGITFIAGYSVYFYVQAQIGSPFAWVMVGIAIGMVGNAMAFPAMRYLSRRSLLMVFSFISGCLMFAMAIVYTKSTVGNITAGKALVGCSIVFTWAYDVGQGPVMWAVATEVPSQRLRSQTVGLSSGVNFVFGWLVSFCTPYFINPTRLNWGPKYGYIWGASNFIIVPFVFFFVPETKGRSLEQLDELFAKRVPTLEFKSFVTEHIAIDAEKDPMHAIGDSSKAGGETILVESAERE
jgi:SP family sugar:H+ symporter-like MFS transporter